MSYCLVWPKPGLSLHSLNYQYMRHSFQDTLNHIYWVQIVMYMVNYIIEIIFNKIHCINVHIYLVKIWIYIYIYIKLL